MSASDSTEVQNFYRDCGVFVTGGTGFLGKLTIEKILRCCPAVKIVYVLIRPKKGLSVEDRKKVMLDDVVFERMKSEQPDSVRKIVFVPGDCSEPRMGLSDTHYNDLTRHVNIVLHLAATVRFDESLKVAVNINVKGSQEVLNLCRDCISLKAAVFVSTAYSNCVHHYIKEEFYEPPIVPNDLFYLMEKFTEEELNIIFPKIKGLWPNTYVFSKAVAEHLIWSQAKDLPVSVVRPSMVASTISEPLPGWLDNMYGPIGIAVGGGCGVLRVYYVKEEAVLDIVPADMVVNCTLAVTFATNKRNNAAVPVYNITAPEENPLTVKRYQNILMDLVEESPFTNMIWYPTFVPTTNHNVYRLLSFFLEFLPALIVEFGLWLYGLPLRMLKITRKIHKLSILTSYFATQDWKFAVHNTKYLYEKLSYRDKELFHFDTSEVDWLKYRNDSTLGVKKYLFNETLECTEKSRYRVKKFYMAHTALKISFYTTVAWTLLCVMKFVFNRWF